MTSASAAAAASTGDDSGFKEIGSEDDQFSTFMDIEKISSLGPSDRDADSSIDRLALFSSAGIAREGHHDVAGQGHADGGAHSRLGTEGGEARLREGGNEWAHRGEGASVERQDHGRQDLGRELPPSQIF